MSRDRIERAIARMAVLCLLCLAGWMAVAAVQIVRHPFNPGSDAMLAILWTALISLAVLAVSLRSGRAVPFFCLAGLTAGFLFISTPFIRLWLTSAYYNLPV